jgi:hypothetical protein
MLAGFFRFLLAGNGVAAFWEDEPRRAVIVSEMQHGDLAVTYLRCS